MSYNFLHLVAILVMVCVFFHWTEVFPCSQATPFFFWLKFFWERIPLSGKLFLRFTVIKGPVLLVKNLSKCALYGQLCNTVAAVTPSVLWFT